MWVRGGGLWVSSSQYKKNLLSTVLSKGVLGGIFVLIWILQIINYDIQTNTCILGVEGFVLTTATGGSRAELVEFLPLQSKANLEKSWTLSISPSPIDTSVTNDGNTDASYLIDNDSTDDLNEELSAFSVLAGNVANVILKSDLKREQGGDGACSTGWTSWVDDSAAYQLKSGLDGMNLNSYSTNSISNSNAFGNLIRRDEALAWTKWMKSSPSPMLIEMSNEFRQELIQYITEEDLNKMRSTRQELLSRIGLRIVSLPSGGTLTHPFLNPPGALIYGKLLYGGARRFRILPGKMARRTGDRESIKRRDSQNVPSWLQYGGTARNYEALDMGPCAIMEVIILATGFSMESIFNEKSDMVISQFKWNPSSILQFDNLDEQIDSDNDEKNKEILKDNDPLLTSYGYERNELLEASLTTTVGGLQTQVESIIRRVLDGRIIRPFDNQNDNGDILPNHNEESTTTLGMMKSTLEAKELAALGLNPVKGLLLYGPPGCGKTALAREISKALRARTPKIVSAPELLDRWVGGSEKLIRTLFLDAEDELKACGGDATKSTLHVIVIDEIDAVFRKRSYSDDSAQVTRASAVNQILAKLDGVNAIPNILLIGMTNRRELLDDALLRPGRLEVQIEIPLPNKTGRREILQIHFDSLRRRGRLSQPLCNAIDGIKSHSVDDGEYISKNSSIRKIFQKIPKRNKISDLSAVTKGFSGADLAGLVRCAGSIALARLRQQGEGLDSLLITLNDVTEALKELQK
mmetsp:Transcript_17841/g.25220  ORF Transcript_17841/g.25220 Transcript_17841/m.25220 type:complete len:750 (-) Transcript_17841:211-2460(-)|eukprot:CAMPEP_0184859744 /NCGR_PEP_ID=MMETSP0580-20130426/4735_1 /TAXON_ID=1118495 /ORGANISM="Dactyliosolen fragilissimus" /LENGTH=749 /DNA_ID=CAMNT_0027356549 /DNA_START=33 /DNA_END=2282 /DNA_ORIENTATION=+